MHLTSRTECPWSWTFSAINPEMMGNAGGPVVLFFSTLITIILRRFKVKSSERGAMSSLHTPTRMLGNQPSKFLSPRREVLTDGVCSLRSSEPTWASSLVLGSSLLSIAWLLSHSCSYIAMKMPFTPRERVGLGVGAWGGEVEREKADRLILKEAQRRQIGIYWRYWFSVSLYLGVLGD